MYCGDDVEAVVGDVGTSLSKFGMAGEDTPKLVVPSVVAHKTPPNGASASESSSKQAPASPYVVGDLFAVRQAELLRPMEACAVTNWDALEQMWKYAFDHLYVDPKEHPVITSAPACFANDALVAAAARDAEKYMEMMFEKFDVPCFYIAKDAVLDAFAFGKSSALVAEIGAGATRVVPVFDGYPLQRPAQYSSVGCERLSEYLAHLVAQRENAPLVRPRCCFSRRVNANGKLETTMLPAAQISPPVMPTSYYQYMRSEVFRDMRECVATTSAKALTEDKLQNYVAEEQRYELPDGQVIALGRERFQVAEYLLHPRPFADAPLGAGASGAPGGGSGSVKSEAAPTSPARALTKGLHRMLYDAVQLCDADLRRDMVSNIILCGGGSVMTGLTERLHAELTAMVPSSFKVRFTNVMKVERQFSCFIGGSILASLGSFQQLWVSRREYDEVGARRLCAERFM